MQSQPGSQGSSSGPVVLELAKFSVATVPVSSSAPVSWSHFSSNVRLFACFETKRSFNSQGSIEEKSVFKVLKDPEVVVRKQIDTPALLNTDDRKSLTCMLSLARQSELSKRPRMHHNMLKTTMLLSSSRLLSSRSSIR
jgi:hypothetical protein